MMIGELIAMAIGDGESNDMDRSDSRDGEDSYRSEERRDNRMDSGEDDSESDRNNGIDIVVVMKFGSRGYEGEDQSTSDSEGEGEDWDVDVFGLF